jgi:hypothetical protein
MATPSPKAPGTNSQGRTYDEQVQYQRYQNSKNIGKGSDPSLLETFVKGMFKQAPAKKVTPANVKNAIAEKKAKKVVPASKSGIPASPTH